MVWTGGPGRDRELRWGFSVGWCRNPIAGLARRLWDAPGTESARTLLEALAKEARRDRITGLGAEVAFS